MAFAEKLKKLRMKKKASLQQVADAVGSSKAHIFDLEKGTSANPSKELLLKLADYFHTSVSDLVGEDPNAPDEEPQLIALYRDLKTLEPDDRETIRLLMERIRHTRGTDGGLKN
jgi:transcriptional regulator with XRE-family HTH domain